MKILMTALLLLTLGACASHKNEQPVAVRDTASVQKEAAYGGNCAMGMCLKKDVKGDEKYSVDYKGKHYIFSTEEARDKFISNIDSNIKKADQEWAKRLKNSDRL